MAKIAIKKERKMIFEDELIFVERETSEIPWVKIFTKTPFKELTDYNKATQKRIFEAVLTTEKIMRKFYNPAKINIASFANYVPRVHFHVMARFESDSFFPEPMWGKKQREGELNLPDFAEFSQILADALKRSPRE